MKFKMKKISNSKYLLDNLDFEIPICHWIMYLDNFFGKEKAEEFYGYLINARDIMRKNDIRKLLGYIGFSIYSVSDNEQLAFISIYKPVNTKSKLLANLEKGTKQVFELYKRKNLQIVKDIKKLGYSFESAKFNWKDKELKDTYQREYIFILYSEKNTCEQFQKNLTELARKYNVKEILITDNMNDKSTRMQVRSNIIDVNTGKTKQAIEDTTIDTVEAYLSNISGTKVLFKIPYENNKTVLNKDIEYLSNYYSLAKQERIRNMRPYSYNSAMFKGALLNRFEQVGYNK